MSETPGWAAPGWGPPERPAVDGGGDGDGAPARHLPPTPSLAPPEAGTAVAGVPPPPPGEGPPGWGEGPPGWGGAQPGRGGQPGWGGGQPGWGAAQPGGGQPGWGGAQPGWGGQPGWGQRRTEPKPGVIPLRPLGLSELLDGAIAIVRTYPKVTLGLSAIVMTVTQLIRLVINAYYLPTLSGLTTNLNSGSPPDTGALTDFLGGLAAAVGAGLIVSWLGVLVLTGMLTVVVGKAVLGEPITMGQAWSELRPRLLRLLGVTLLTALVISGLALGCLLPGLVAFAAGAPGVLSGLLVAAGGLAAVALVAVAYVQLSLATPALVLERTSVRGALRRSRALVRHSWWRVAGILILAAVVAGVLNSVLTVPFAIFGGGSPFDLSGSGPDLGFGALLLSAIGAIIAGTIVQPFNAGVQALLYVDRRMRAEGLDVTLAEAAARRSVPVA